MISSATEELDDIDRVHDETPEAAAARLRVLDSAQLPADRLPLLAFLFNHVIGEKFGAWVEAAQYINGLCSQRADVPLAVTMHAAVADDLAGARNSAAHAALVALSSESVAATAIALRRLSFTQESMDTTTFAAMLKALSQQASELAAPTALDAQLAAGLNNATSRLLDLDWDKEDATTIDALTLGATQALRFWQRVGTWVNHERALYLVAVVANRLRNFAGARDAARQALASIAANGTEEVDRAFLLLHLAGALDGLDETEASDVARHEARVIAAHWTDRSLTDWFAEEEARLFDTT